MIKRSVLYVLRCLGVVKVPSDHAFRIAVNAMKDLLKNGKYVEGAERLKKNDSIAFRDSRDNYIRLTKQGMSFNRVRGAWDDVYFRLHYKKMDVWWELTVLQRWRMIFLAWRIRNKIARDGNRYWRKQNQDNIRERLEGEEIS